MSHIFCTCQDLNLGLSGHTSDEEMPTPEECITKIGALLRVFTTVMRSLGEYFMPDKGPAVTVDFMTNVYGIFIFVFCNNLLMK